MDEEPYASVVAIGTWLYDGQVSREIELLARSAKWAHGRWLEDEHGNFVLNEQAPCPETPDGFVYFVGTGPQFATAQEAISWADAQPWGPVQWRHLGRPQKKV